LFFELIEPFSDLAELILQDFGLLFKEDAFFILSIRRIGNRGNRRIKVSPAPTITGPPEAASPAKAPADSAAEKRACRRIHKSWISVTGTISQATPAS
jgi:hypothetical protein